MTARVETLGSVWLIDDVEKRYCRMPKSEKPRENGWGDETAGVLQDAVWHAFEGGWWISDTTGRLVIQVEFVEGRDWLVVSAPNAVVLSGRPS